jgi:hypothetical protein
MGWEINWRAEDAPESRRSDLVARIRRADILYMTDPDVSHLATSSMRPSAQKPIGAADGQMFPLTSAASY